MATLDRRVQILFDPAQYASLQTEAAEQKQSVAAIVREAVDERLRTRKASRQDALDRLFASGDANPSKGVIDWEAEKDALERDHLRNLP